MHTDTVIESKWLNVQISMKFIDGLHSERTKLLYFKQYFTNQSGLFIQESYNSNNILIKLIRFFAG